MCLMLYVATEVEEPISTGPSISVEELDSAHRDVIRPVFSLPHIRFIGAHTGCSCGFPSVIAEEPVEYFEGLFSDSEDREQDLESARALVALVRRHIVAGRGVEMFPVWFIDEGGGPKGTVDLTFSSIQPETFVFTQNFLYRVHG